MRAVDAFGVADPTACDLCGLEGCEDPSHAPLGDDVAIESARHQPTPRLVFQSAASVIDEPAPPEVIEGVAWVGNITLNVAESGAGKTFVNLSQAAALSAGLPTWHGRRLVPGSTAYVSFEGDALGKRLRAIRDVQGLNVDHVHLLRATDPLSPRMGRDYTEEPSRGELDVAEALDDLRTRLEREEQPPIRLLVIDTVRASLTGSEDLSDNAAAYLRVARRLLARLPAAGGLLTHHAGWQDGEAKRKRERGSSAWRGNVDATLYLEAGEPDALRRETPIVLHTHKARDSEKAAPLHLIRRVVELCERDRYGRPLTSCVIEADSRSHHDRATERQAAMDAEHQVFDLRTLRTIIERPDMASSQDKLRLLLGVRKTLVGDSLTRLVQRGWAAPGARQQPYMVTPAGLTAIQEASI